MFKVTKGHFKHSSLEMLEGIRIQLGCRDLPLSAANAAALWPYFMFPFSSDFSVFLLKAPLPRRSMPFVGGGLF